jgi:hypothetical protein
MGTRLIDSNPRLFAKVTFGRASPGIHGAEDFACGFPGDIAKAP